MLVIDGMYDYKKAKNRQLLKEVIDQARAYGNMDKSYQISWIRNCTNFENISEFIERNPSFEQDIAWKDDRIIASRFYVRSRWVSTADEEGDLMKFMRDTVMNDTNGNKLIAFSPQFVYFEHYVSIVKNTLLSVTVCIIGMLFVAIMFIPHPISITCVALSMLSIVIGMFGLMHLWNVALSSITTVQVILSVGLCVDFTVHISHAFMAATGKNRNERVSTALNKVGVPILNGALSSILGIIMLASAHSYIFVSFFKTMLLVIVLGLFHSLLVLPVLLSFIGPRRTSKPRVYIPISPSSRSIQPMEAPRRPSSLRCSNNQRIYKQDSREDQERISQFINKFNQKTNTSLSKEYYYLSLNLAN
ncbi:unnamed protein product [Dimorphilus gyrociliatus]|uniref:Uncharacterized protein n=1 Tax=Dimorphilus gyrociliatus TaxID=2664684 RepID=A0A7I8VIA2_9ANNE|nr:unnamed protein product [Dimorphilus gyrociliatus]